MENLFHHSAFPLGKSLSWENAMKPLITASALALGLALLAVPAAAHKGSAGGEGHHGSSAVGNQSVSSTSQGAGLAGGGEETTKGELASIGKEQSENFAQGATSRIRHVNFGTVISSLNHVKEEIQDIGALSNLTASQVRIVNISDLLRGNNLRALENAFLGHRMTLDDFLRTDQVLKSALNLHHVSISRVVGFEVLSNDKVEVFVL